MRTDHRFNARDDIFADQTLAAVIMALPAIINLLAVRNMAGRAGHFTQVAAVRVFNQIVSSVSDVLITDMALQAHFVANFNLWQRLFVIAGHIQKTGANLGRNGIIVALFALHPGLVMDIIQVGAGQVRIHVAFHNMAGTAEHGVGIALVQQDQPANTAGDDSHNDDIDNHTDFEPAHRLFIRRCLGWGGG